MAYITATHLLEMLPAKTLVVNNPAEVRNAPEKLLVTRFADLMPPTVISRDLNVIRAFRTKYKDIIIADLVMVGQLLCLVSGFTEPFV